MWSLVWAGTLAALTLVLSNAICMGGLTLLGAKLDDLVFHNTWIFVFILVLSVVAALAVFYNSEAITEALRLRTVPSSNAGAKPTPPAAGIDPRATAVWRQLITDCPHCGVQFRWLDKGSMEEAPFCPNCGYDAVFNGERTAIDPEGRPQPAVLPSLPGGIVSCDKCGATNSSTGAPVEQILQFSLSRCQSCRKTFCARCVGLFPANMPCPHCGKISHYLSEDYDYV